MIREFSIKNFRGFDEFKIDNLGKINLISGKNNVGKTALLEALFLHYGSTNPQLTFLINSFRGMGGVTIEFRPFSQNPFESLFFDLDHSKIIELSSIDKFNNFKSVKIRYNPKLKFLKTEKESNKKDLSSSTRGEAFESDVFPIIDFEDIQNKKSTHYQLQITPQGVNINKPMNLKFETHFISSRSRTTKEDAKLFSEIDKTNYNQIKEIEKILQIIDSRIKRLSIIHAGDDVIIHGDIGLRNSLPLPLMGEGLSKLTSILLRIAHAENGVVLIDEIENGFHFSILKDIWRAILDAANKFNVQIFTTTHSYECIKAAYSASLEIDEKDFVLHRLVRIDDEIHHKLLDKNKLAIAIDSNFEVR